MWGSYPTGPVNDGQANDLHSPYTKVEYKKLKCRHIECKYSRKYTASYKEPPHVSMNIVV